MRRYTIIFAFTSVLTGLAGCSDFPDLDAAVSERARRADYPQILPLDSLVAAVPPVEPGLGVGNLPERLRVLQARAHAIRARQIIDSATRARMQAALQRHL